MKLWILKPREDLPDNHYGPDYDPEINPWSGSYDMMLGFVVRAETEVKARAIAHEGGDLEIHHGAKDAWTSALYSTCEELLAKGEAGLILEDRWDA